MNERPLPHRASHRLRRPETAECNERWAHGDLLPSPSGSTAQRGRHGSMGLAAVTPLPQAPLAGDKLSTSLEQTTLDFIAGASGNAKMQVVASKASRSASIATDRDLVLRGRMTCLAKNSRMGRRQRIMITLRLTAALAVIVSATTFASAQTPSPSGEAKPAAASQAQPADANAVPHKPEPQPAAKAADDAKPAASEAKPATTPPEPVAPPPKPTLAVDSGTGAFAQAYREIVLTPFESHSGTRIASPGKDGAGEADVLMLDAAELDRGCRDDKLAELDLAKLDPDSTKQPARDDFLEGAVKPCGIGQMAWSTLFVFDPVKLAKRPPKSIADVFDIKRFPGKRALPANGRGLFEALLAADGVAAADIYRKLDSADGLQRAISRLSAIAAHVVWYERMGDAIAMLRTGEATVALTSSGHAFVEQARSGPLGLIWDAQVLDVSYLAVRKSAAEQARARDLIAYATAPERLAAMAQQIPYGPMRRSSVALATRHSVTGQMLAPYLPTSPANLETAIRFDPAWWQANEARVREAVATAKQTPPPAAASARSRERSTSRR